MTTLLISHPACLDLRALVSDAVNRGYIQNSWYLIGVEAGFELWRGGTGLASQFVVRPITLVR